MNKLALLIFFCISSLSALEFQKYKDALKLQERSGKTIMIDVMRTNCHYCKDMDNKVFKNVQMSKWLENRFISVQVNLDNDKIPLDLKVHFTPTFFFIDKNGDTVKKIPGSWNIEDFKDLTSLFIKNNLKSKEIKK